MLECTLPYPVSSRFFQSRRALTSIASSPSFDFLYKSPTCLVAVPRKVMFSAVEPALLAYLEQPTSFYVAF